MCDPRPSYEEENPSFSINADGTLFNRFGDDGKGGNALTFLVSLGRSKGDAALELIQRAGLEGEDKAARGDIGKPAPISTPRDKPASSRARLKADRALERFHILSEDESTKLSNWLSPIIPGSEAERELERRGLLPYLGTVYRASTLSRERKAGKRTLGVCGALVLEVASPAAAPWQGQPWALKIRNPGSKDELKVKGLERYTYLSSGHGSPPLCLSPKSDSDAVLLIEGELSAVAAHVALEHLNRAFHIQGVAGASAHPYSPQLEGKRVFIYADLGEGGDKARQNWSTLALECGAASVHILAPLEGNRDFCDVLGAKGLDALAQYLITALEQAKPFTLEPEPETQQPSKSGETSLQAGIYSIRNGRPQYQKPTKEGSVDVPLCNFSAFITSAVSKDDGAERSAFFTLEGTLDDGTHLPSIEVSTSEFASLNWAIKFWGAYGAIVYAGQAVKDHLRAAIQELSRVRGMVRREVFAHTGWRTVQGVTAYLSSGAVIGPDGPLEGIEVELSDKLKGYALPTPPTGEVRKRAVLESLKLLEVAPDRVTLPMLAQVYRAPISPTRYAEHAYGISGSAKSGLAAVALQHFKPSADRYNLTAEWKDTDNTLERLLFELKDSLNVFDDFNPTGSGPNEANKWHAKAERVFRAQGNGSGRGRMRADLTLRAPMPPRGSLLSTGEELPKGYSLQARVFTVSLAKGDVDLERLKTLTQSGKQGVLASSMSAYVQWLAPQLEAVKTNLEDLAEEYQGLFPASHGRITDTAADLLAGFSIFRRFAVEVGALSLLESRELHARAIAALSGVSSAQAQYLEQNSPALRFFELLGSLLSSGAVFVASAENEEAPSEPEKWGWEKRIHHSSEGEFNSWEPRSKTRVGWVTAKGELYLEPDTAFAEVQRRAGTQGNALSRTAQTLWKELGEQGFILPEKGKDSSGNERNYNTVKRTVNGRRPRVLNVALSTLQNVWALWAGGEKADSDVLEESEGCGRAHTENVGASEQPMETISAPPDAHKTDVGAPTSTQSEHTVSDGIKQSRPQSPQDSAPRESRVKRIYEAGDD